MTDDINDTTLERKCCFHMKRSMARYNETDNCQFTGWEKPLQFASDGSSDASPGETKFFEVDGKHYCRFHMPLKDKSGKPTEKTNWSRYKPSSVDETTEYAEFKRGISELVRFAGNYSNRCEQCDVIDLAGVIFPPSFGDLNLAEWLKPYPIRQNDLSLFNVCADGVIFGGPVLSEGVTFQKKMNFPGAIFEKDANFIRAEFRGAATFEGAVFEGVADFSGAEGGPSFQRMNFFGAKFKGAARFINRKFSEPVDFKNATFHVAPDFHGAELHQGCTIGKATFADCKTDGAEDAYRILKLAMEQMRNWNGMAKFHALELKSIRKTSWTVEKLSDLYEGTSDYGQSATLPIVWMGVLMYVCFFLHLFFFSASGNTLNWSVLANVLHFDLLQMVRPLHALVFADSQDTVLCNMTTFWRGVTMLTAAIQSLTTLSLATLFILAVRRRFRMA